MELEPVAAEQFAHLVGWAYGDAGRALARRRLDGFGLSTDPAMVDDVVQQAVIKVHRRLATGGPLDGRAGAVEAYATTTIANVVRDLLRSPRARQEIGLSDQAWATLAADPGVEAEATDVGDRARRGLQRAAGERPGWVVAAGLVVTALAEAPDLALRPEVVVPASGPATHRPRWIGLWYAGRDDLLPGPDGVDDVNRRNRRSRAFTTLDGVLTAAFADVHDGTDDSTDDGTVEEAPA